MADNENLNTEVEPVEVVHDLPIGRSLLGATLGASAAEQEPDEEYSTIPVAELVEVKLGRQGENNTQTVVIDCSAWLAKLPGCTFMIAATRPGEREIYLPEVSVSSGVVTWPIMEQDTACAGAGRAEVRAMKDGKVKKSALFRTRVEPALEGDGSPDAPTPPNWVRLIIESVEASQAAAEHAEELVDEATACAINAVRFDQDQNLTDAQKAVGRGNIDALGLKQGAANAGKVLLVGADGNVTLGDAVQIDATLQQAGQAADAAAVGTALAGKVAVNQGAANAGKVLLVGADGNVITGEGGIPEAVKSALLQCFEKVAWVNGSGQQYYDALYEALYASRVLSMDDIASSVGITGLTVDNNGSIDYLSCAKYSIIMLSQDLTRIKYRIRSAFAHSSAIATVFVFRKESDSEFWGIAGQNVGDVRTPIPIRFVKNGNQYDGTTEGVQYPITYENFSSFDEDNEVEAQLVGGTLTISNQYGAKLSVSGANMLGWYSHSLLAIKVDNVSVTGHGGSDSRLEAVYNPGGHVVYLDDALETLRPYLTVRRYDGDSSSIVTNYTLSGTLTAGTSVITVQQGSLSATVNIATADWYNKHRYALSSGDLAILDDTVYFEDWSICMGLREQVDTDGKPIRRHTALTYGFIPYKIRAYEAGEPIDVFYDSTNYPIPIPANATTMRVSATPATTQCIVAIARISGNQQTHINTDAFTWAGMPRSIQLESGVKRTVAIDFRVDAENTPFSSATEPTEVIVEFE